MSTEDVQKGAPWLQEINQSLAKSQGIGIFCVTPENVSAPWLTFEAGFLAGSGGQSRVCVVAVGMDLTDIPAPLNLFQATKVEPNDFKRLLASLNCQTERPLADAVLTRAFQTHWPQLEQDLRGIAQQPPTSRPVKKRSQEDLLQEIVESNRRIEAAIASRDSLENGPDDMSLSVRKKLRRQLDERALNEAAPESVQSKMIRVLELGALKGHPDEMRELVSLGLELLGNKDGSFNLTDYDKKVLTNRISQLREQIARRAAD